MMNNWLFLSVLSMLILGVLAFINKIFAEKKYDQKTVAIILYGLIVIIMICYIFLFNLFDVTQVTSLDLIGAIIWGVGAYFYSIIMMTALRYLPTATYFIGVRILSAVGLLFVGTIFFYDKISIIQLVGFFIGIIAVMMLFNKKEKDARIDYKHGIVWFVFGVFVLIIIHSIVKYFSVKLNINVLILLIMYLTAFVCSLIFGGNNLKKYKNDIIDIVKINIFQAILSVLYFILLFKVYAIGNLGISYKIQSYSPFVPIILSYFIYNEKIIFRKKVALIEKNSPSACCGVNTAI